MKKIIAVIFLSGFSVGLTYKPEVILSVSEYGPLPNPQIVMDRSNFPNQAFSDVELQRYNQEYAKEYVKTYLQEYAKSRSIPSSILPAALILRELKDFKPTEGSFQNSLKTQMDRWMLFFEYSGAIELEGYLNQEVNAFETKLSELKQSAPEGSPAKLFFRYLEVKKKIQGSGPTFDKMAGLSKKADELAARVAELKWFLVIGWIGFLAILVAGFRAWRIAANTTIERKIV